MKFPNSFDAVLTSFDKPKNDIKVITEQLATICD